MFRMMAVSLVLSLGCELTKKCFTAKASDDPAAGQLFISLSSIVAVLIFLLWGGLGSVSLFTGVLGVVFGLATTLQMVFHMKALQTGPWAYTVVIVSLSTLLTALSGTIFWNETLSIVQIIGIVFMVVCLILSVNTKTEQKKATLKWFLYCMLAFLCCGSVGIMQKWHGSSAYGAEVNAFLTIAFIVCILFSSVSAAVQSNDIRASVRRDRKNLLVFGILYGIFFSVVNKLNLQLAGAMDSAVFFPVVNGGSLILTTITAVVLFKEKLTLRQWCGMACGIVSVILVCDPF